MRWAEPRQIGAALLAALLAGCAAGPSPGTKPAPEPPRAAASISVAPTTTGAVTLPELPADSLVIVLSGKNTYTVQDAHATCEGLPGLLEPYRQANLVLAGGEGAELTVADAICVALAAKRRGGKAYMAHPEGLRSIDIQD